MPSKIPIRGDEITIEKVGGNAVLILKNSTRTVDGFLWNEGDGSTRFKKVMISITSESDLDLYGRNDGDYVAVSGNNSIYEWRPTGTPNGTTIFDADDSGVWFLILGVGGAGLVPYYEVTLGAVLSFTVTFATHGITNVRGATVLTPGRAEIDLYTELRANDDVYIESNILLTGYILKIY
jgi:hypothetical protein